MVTYFLLEAVDQTTIGGNQSFCDFNVLFPY